MACAYWSLAEAVRVDVAQVEGAGTALQSDKPLYHFAEANARNEAAT